MKRIASFLAAFVAVVSVSLTSAPSASAVMWYSIVSNDDVICKDGTPVATPYTQHGTHPDTGVAFTVEGTYTPDVRLCQMVKNFPRP